jgi:hypothetical protein
MIMPKAVIVIGIATIVFGIIFQFQGRGMVGPESSFMYYNKDWIDYGIGIVFAGITICGIGVFALIRARLHAR